MIHNAVDIAEYIISFCYRQKKPITNLQLQKVLYYVQGYSLALNDLPAFQDEIFVWQYGPVVQTVYDKFCMYAAMPIENNYKIELNDHLLEKLIQIVTVQKIDIPVWDLVDQTHNEAPWKYTKQVYGIGSIIPKDFIKKYFKSLVGNKK